MSEAYLIMAESIICSECGVTMADAFENEPECEPLCAACAARYIQHKSERRKVVNHLLEMNGLSDEDVDPETFKKLAKITDSTKSGFRNSTA